MAEVYLYLDETGDLEISGEGQSSAYFGLGSATFRGDQARQYWEGTKLRFRFESEGVRLPKGFHAKDNPNFVRASVVDLILRHRPRIDTTLLYKRNAYAGVVRRIEEDEIYLYYLAWWMHFKFQAQYLLRPSDKVFVVAASVSEHKKKQEAATKALNDVLARFPQFDITLCVWDSPSSWGLQVADYGLWAVQRQIRKGNCTEYIKLARVIESVFRPWEGIAGRPAKAIRDIKRPAANIADRLVSSTRAPVDTPVPEAGQYGDDASRAWWENDKFPDEEDMHIEDPLGVGLWGNAPWTDEDPWEPEDELPFVIDESGDLSAP